MPFDVPICDCHLHLWDTTARPNPNLGSVVTSKHPLRDSFLGVYTTDDYLTDMSDLPLRGGVHIEVCVGQADGGHVLDPLAETAFVLQQAGRLPASVPLGIVAFVQLARQNAPEVLSRHQQLAGSRLRGVRMILNYSASDPSQCWPQVDADYLKGDNEVFNRNFPLMASNGLVFDLQVNWHQLAPAAAYIQRFAPDTVVVLNHLGCLKLLSGDRGGGAPLSTASSSAAAEEEDARRVAEWRRGMTALAANPRVYCKISMLEYTCPGWLDAASPQRAAARQLVAYAVSAFGTDRCMVASNNPVDLHNSGRGLQELFGGYRELLAGHSREELEAMFNGNAARAYGLDKVSA